MRRSLFKKYFAITMVIVLISYILLGTVMMLFNYNYWREEKKALLTHNVSSIASFAGEFTIYLGEGNNYGIEAESLGAFMNIISENVNADIFVTDTSKEDCFYSAEFDGQTRELLCEEGTFFASEQAKQATVNRLLDMLDQLK